MAEVLKLAPVQQASPTCGRTWSNVSRRDKSRSPIIWGVPAPAPPSTAPSSDLPANRLTGSFKMLAGWCNSVHICMTNSAEGGDSGTNMADKSSEATAAYFIYRNSSSSSPLTAAPGEPCACLPPSLPALLTDSSSAKLAASLPNKAFCSDVHFQV